MFTYFLARLTLPLSVFLSLQTSLRLAFVIKEWAHIDSLYTLAQALVLGCFMDVCVSVYALIPFVLYAAFSRTYRACSSYLLISLYAVFNFILLFDVLGEWLFWDEFSSRFNFIAVDYLIYTHEVIGNIKESYPIGLLITVITILSIGLAIVIHRLHKKTQSLINLNKSMMFLAGYTCLIGLVFVSVDHSPQTFPNRYLTEISRNGLFELFSAYRQNELSYDQFYPTLQQEDITPYVHQLVTQNPYRGKDPLRRRITKSGIEQRPNLILITVESLSASYMKYFGNTDNLTPHLDALAQRSLFFTDMLAIGTRTVYGLAAISLSIPPLPGNAIVRRPGNENLSTLGSILKSKGYASKFIYGGFGYFDNMNNFFQGNGYEVIDRSDLSSKEITFSNIWGVCDEDLLRRVIKEGDKEYAQGRPFFSMVMTTSNHRPYTYPDGKIDLPSGFGRWGGIKYTDYAIGEFIRQIKTKPWFKNTLIVIVADHTAGSMGKIELDPTKYHIPMLVYAPYIVPAKKMTKLASQIDVAPTILGLMNISYTSVFYGQDLMDPHASERAFISNYRQLGYIDPHKNLLIFKPVKQEVYYQRHNNELRLSDQACPLSMRQEAIAYFQSSANLWKEWNREVSIP